MCAGNSDSDSEKEFDRPERTWCLSCPLLDYEEKMGYEESRAHNMSAEIRSVK